MHCRRGFSFLSSPAVPLPADHHTWWWWVGEWWWLWLSVVVVVVLPNSPNPKYPPLFGHSPRPNSPDLLGVVVTSGVGVITSGSVVVSSDSPQNSPRPISPPHLW